MSSSYNLRNRNSKSSHLSSKSLHLNGGQSPLVAENGTIQSDKQPATTTRHHHHLTEKQKKEIQSLVLWRRPFQTIYYAWHQLIELLNNLSQWIIHHSRLCLSVTIFLLILVLLLRIDGQHQPVVQYLYKRLAWCVYWCFLGILSSVGLGTGLHTFILYLGPHISEVTRAAYICKSLDFPEPPYPDQIICPTNAVETSITVWAIMSKVRLESFMWGAGTALGELPPYFISRAHRLAAGPDGGGPDAALLEEFEELEDLVPGLEPEPAAGTTRRTSGGGTTTASMATTIKTNMIAFMKRMGFFGILACASIPNPLFDLAGIICGLSLIPFWTFFGATLLGKAVIKMHIQMLVVIIVFNETYVQSVLSFCKNIPYVGHYIHDPLRDYLEQQKLNLNRRPGDASSAKPPSGPGAWISFMFELFVLGMVTYFLVSIINSMAQSNLKQRYHEEMEKRKVDHHQGGKKKLMVGGKTTPATTKSKTNERAAPNHQQKQETAGKLKLAAPTPLAVAASSSSSLISGMSPKKLDKND